MCLGVSIISGSTPDVHRNIKSIVIFFCRLEGVLNFFSVRDLAEDHDRALHPDVVRISKFSMLQTLISKTCIITRMGLLFLLIYSAIGAI